MYATSNNPLEGLEAQSKLVKQLGDEEFDRELDEVEREPDSMIYTGVNDDCETENEEEEAEKEKEAKKKGSEYKASRWDEKRTVSFFFFSSWTALSEADSLFIAG